MTNSVRDTQQIRVLFLGAPTDPVEADRWTEFRSRFADAGIEITSEVDDDLDYAIVAEDILDGYCTAAEALSLQKLRVREVSYSSTCADPGQIVTALLHSIPGAAPVVPISTASTRIFGRTAAADAV